MQDTACNHAPHPPQASCREHPLAPGQRQGGEGRGVAARGGSTQQEGNAKGRASSEATAKPDISWNEGSF